MKVLITDDLHPVLPELLERQGWTCEWAPDIQQAEVGARLGDFAGLVVATKIRVTRSMLEAAPRLRFIARAGSGMEHIDQAAAAERGIAVLSSPEGNADAVAEHSVGLLLALYNHIPRGDREMRQGLFRREPNRGRELGGKTIGIIGYGHTGSALARRLKGFGMTILAHDRYKTGFGTSEVQECSLERIQEEAHVLSLHLPLTPETKHYVNDALLHRFARPFDLINTSRGQAVDTMALLRALDDGRVSGAALDVFENEKPETYGPEEEVWWKALRTRENVVLSPHVAGLTAESKRRIAEVLAAKIGVPA